MPPARILELNEQKGNLFERGALTVGEALSIADDPRARVEVIWPNPANGHSWRLNPKGWVGAFPVGSGLLLRIIPKMPVRHLFELQQWSGNDVGFRLFDGIAPVEGVEEMLEVAARLLCKRVARRIGRGLRKGYVERQVRGQTPRGRVDILASTTRFASGRISFVWKEQPLTVDIEDNRIIAWTLNRTARVPSLRPDTRAEILRLERMLAVVTSLEPFSADDCEGRSYGRPDLDYAAIHALCALVLKGIGPTPARGHVPFLPFGIDVPTVFERGVANILRDRLGPDFGLVAKPMLPIGDGMRFIPDAVVTSGNGTPVAVIDTKYKQELNEADVQQVVAYATALRISVACLVYPNPVEGRPLMVGPVGVHPVTFDLASPPEKAADALALSLKAIINNSLSLLIKTS